MAGGDIKLALVEAAIAVAGIVMGYHFWGGQVAFGMTVTAFAAFACGLLLRSERR